MNADLEMPNAECGVRNGPPCAAHASAPSALRIPHSAFAAACLLLAAMLALAADSTNAAPAPSTLEFLDGSKLFGTLQQIDRENGVRWRHPGARQPMEFAPTNLHQVRFTPPPGSSSTVPTCRFRFANGDEVLGEVVTLDADKIVMDTWFGGRLTAPRRELRAITINGAGNTVLYEGPADDSGWKYGGSGVAGVQRQAFINPGVAIAGAVAGLNLGGQPVTNAWRYHNNGFVSTGLGTLGRDFKLPPVARLEFDLAWKTAPSMRIALYTETVDRMDYNSGYQFYLSSTYMYLYRRSGNDGGVVFSATENARIPQMSMRTKVRMEMRINKEKETATLLCDGQHIKTWRVSGAQPEGTGILFYSQRTDGAVRISNLRVSAWDGRDEVSAPANSITETLVMLANSDKVTGNVNAIKEGKLALAGAAGELEIPLQRATQVFFPSGTNAVASASNPREVRATLVRGDAVTFELDRWEGASVSGTSPNFGKVSLRTDGVRQLLFNPGLTRPPTDDLGSWDDSPAGR
jgi:hypothetical protein